MSNFIIICNLLFYTFPGAGAIRLLRAQVLIYFEKHVFK
jgi:hypothetical protein